MLLDTKLLTKNSAEMGIKMSQEKIIHFFNKCAPYWDEWAIRKEDILAKLLDNAKITAGIDVLDIACGTGFLFSDYIKRNVHSVTAIDLSPEMVRIAREKNIKLHDNIQQTPQFKSSPYVKTTDDTLCKTPLCPIKIICGDAQTYQFDQQFDVAMIFNAFPHFMEPEKIIIATAKNLKYGGRIAISHDIGRQELDHHHQKKASEISIPLLHQDDLVKLMSPYFDIDIVIANSDMFQVSGTKK